MNYTYYLICGCYVWPCPTEDYAFGYEKAGRCGRCGEGATQLSPVLTAADALAVFVEDHGRMPEPIGEVPWWKKQGMN